MLTLASDDFKSLFLPIIKRASSNIRTSKVAVAYKANSKDWKVELIIDNCTAQTLQTTLTENIGKNPMDFFHLDVTTSELNAIGFSETTAICIGTPQNKILIIINKQLFKLNPTEELLEVRNDLIASIPLLTKISNQNHLNINLAAELAGTRGGWAILKDVGGESREIVLFRTSTNFQDFINLDLGEPAFNLLSQIDFTPIEDIKKHLTQNANGCIYGWFTQTTLVERLKFKVVLIPSTNELCCTIALIFRPTHSMLLPSVNKNYSFTKTDIFSFLAAQKEGLVVSIEIKHYSSLSKLFGEKVLKMVLQETQCRHAQFLNDKVNNVISAIDGSRRIYFAVGQLDIATEQRIADQLNEFAKNWTMAQEHNEETFRIEIGVGIASTNNLHQTKSEDLILFADLASEISCKNGVPVHIFTTEDYGALIEHNLVTTIISGVNNSTIQPYYQTIFSNSKNAVLAYEALARWTNSAGLIEADTTQLIAALESRGDVLTFTFKFFARVLSDIDAFDIRHPVSVNLSPACLEKGDFSDRILEMVIQENISPSMIYFEITESIELSDSDTARNTISKLKEAGFSIFLDDFGTKFSSLSLLTRHPFAALKIDRSFVKTLGEGKDANGILAAVRDMARSLNMDVVAEGVEDFETAELLKHLGIDLVQGFYYGKPKPPNEVFTLRKI